MSNIFEECRRSSLKYAGGTAFAVEEITFGETWRRVTARAAALQARGVRKGEVVGILSKNSPEWCVTFLAVTSLGALALVLDTNLKIDMHRTMISFVNAKLLYVSKDFADGDYGIGKLRIEETDPPSDFEPAETAAENDVAILIYTSGTTGTPKVVQLTHKNLNSIAWACIKHVYAGPADIFMTVLPLYHVYGILAGFYAPYLAGSALIFQNSLKGPDILGTLAKYPVTVLSAVPQMWEIFFDRLVKTLKHDSMLKYRLFMFFVRFAPDLRHLGLGRLVDKIFYPVHKTFGLRLRLLLSGGSRFGRRYCLYYKNMGFRAVEGYGLTETTGPICGGKYHNPTPICVGKPLGHNFVEVRHLNADGIGEIWLKGDAVTPGYYKNPEATKQAFDQDGWFDSGDLGFLDKNGELHIRGRKKNVIVLDSGKNVYPEDLEAFYLASPLVAEITIFGRRIDGREVVYAVVVPTYKTRDCYTQLKNEFKKIHHGLPTYKIIGDFAVSYDALPRTSTQKVQNHKVIENLEKGIYQVSADDPNFVVKEIKAATPETEKIVAALKETLRVDVFYANETLSDFTVDSLHYIELIAKLEKKLGIHINPSQFIAAPAIENLIEALATSPSSSGQTIKQEIFEGKITARTYNFYNPLIELGLWLLKIYSKVFWRLQIKHGEKLEVNNDLIVSNHQSYLDILWLLCILPYAKRRNICIAGKRELWPLKLIFPGIHVVYVDRSGNYIPALKTAADMLRLGKSLIVFPEGTRSYDGQIGEFKNGVAYLAKNLHKKILPISIKGAYEIFPRKNWLPKFITTQKSSLNVHDKLDPDQFATIEELNDKMKELVQG
ncbi:MAG: AMP-binding protein [Candidatus Margulisbacteria bacterium]|jgi:long-chain acyl-CoA synthetase|nr:AMP-binding protein [Candidatus Margulisiibacteriota bacterium]